MEKVKDMKKKYAMMAVAAVLVCSCGEKKDTQGYQHSVYVTDLAENGENGGRLAASGEGEGAIAGNEGTGAEVSEAGSGEKGEERVYAGIVEEAHLVSLAFKTPGQIEKIFVKEGDYVKKGQLLAQLDDEDYKLGVEAVQIQYDQVKDEVGRAKRLCDCACVGHLERRRGTSLRVGSGSGQHRDQAPRERGATPVGEEHPHHLGPERG